MSYAYVKELQAKSPTKSPTKSPAKLTTTHLKYPLNSPVWRASRGIPCSECGAAVTVDANFCMECGARVLLSTHKGRTGRPGATPAAPVGSAPGRLEGLPTPQEEEDAPLHGATSPTTSPLKGVLVRRPLSPDSKEYAGPRHHVTIQDRSAGLGSAGVGTAGLGTAGLGTAGLGSVAGHKACQHPPGSSSCPCCSAQWPPTRIEGHRPVHYVDPGTFSGSGGSQSQGLSPLTKSSSPTEWPMSPVSPATPASGPNPAGTTRRASLGGVAGVEDHIRNSIREQYQTLAEAFDAFDSDGDGLIDATEFETAIREMFGMNFLTRLEITALMSRCDTDGDGFIDVEEFLNFLKGEPAALASDTVVAGAVERLKHFLEARYSSMRDAFKQLDKGHSGYLGKEDVRQALVATGLTVAEPELEAVVAQFDTNHDGKVSHAEFMKLMAA